MNSFTELMSASQVMDHRNGVFTIYGDGEWTPFPAHIAEDGNRDDEFLGFGAVGDKVYVWRRAIAHTVSHIFVYHSGEWTKLTPLQEPCDPRDKDYVEDDECECEYAVVDDRLYSLNVVVDDTQDNFNHYLRVRVYDTTNHSLSASDTSNHSLSASKICICDGWERYFESVTFCALHGNIIMLRLAFDGTRCIGVAVKPR